MKPKQENYTSFTQNAKRITAELDSLSSAQAKQHPEYGILPDDAPCTNCVELLDKRTETTRYYIANGSQGREFFSQQGQGPINYLDNANRWRSISAKLKPTSNTQVFTAPNQELPTGINFQNQYTTLTQQGVELRFNNLALFAEMSDGSLRPLHNHPANWANRTVGSDGAYIKDAWPGVDIELNTLWNALKSNVIIKQPIDFASLGINPSDIKNIVLIDALTLPQGYTLSVGEHGHSINNTDEVGIYNPQGNLAFKYNQPFVFDNAQDFNAQTVYYRINSNNTISTVVNAQWFLATDRVYPITIDPLVNGPAASMPITGSTHNATCGVNGCQYNMPVSVPPNVTVTACTFNFNYQTANSCLMNQGAMIFRVGTCTSPPGAGIVWTCNAPNPGTCTGANLDIFSDVSACFNPPQCASYNLNFRMEFSRCNPAFTGTCNNICIIAASPWSMTISGRTVEAGNPSSVVICLGNSTNLTVTPQFGVPPYSVVWNPGGFTTNTITVSPSSTTPYVATVTDACGQTAQVTRTVNVTNTANPGFTIAPNPTCVGTTVTLTGLGTAGVNSYDWVLPSSSSPTINNVKVPTVVYPATGTFNVTLNYQVGTCVFPLTQQITVNPNVTPSVNITANPSGPICAGTSVTFTATPTNGGSAPQYQWLVNGTNVGLNQPTYTSTTLNNGDVVTVVMTSNAPCPTPTNATSNPVTINLTNAVTPSVSIAASPGNTICAGTNVTFTATPTNGGTTPSYQWTVNGANVGANSATYSSTTLQTGDVVRVTMTSNSNCVTTPTAISQTITMTVNPVVVPSVNITANPGNVICAGTNVTFTASPTNEGSNPTYVWSLNGALVGTNSPTYSNNALAQGDVVQVAMASTANCAQPIGAASNTIAMTVSPVLNPGVTVSVTPTLPVCIGTNLTFTATPANAGVNPNYQWQVNGSNVGTNSPTYSSGALNNGDAVTVVLTSTSTCAQPATVTSAPINLSITQQVAPTVSITANPTGAICAGTSVTFTATQTGGGTTPTFQWQVNGANVGTNSPTFTSTTLANGDVVTVTLTSSFACANPTTATSAPINMVVNTNLVPSVIITQAPNGQVCQGTAITYTATPTNSGTTPAYQWFVNGVAAGTNSPTFTVSTLNNNDVVTVTLTSNELCLQQPNATSNQLTAQVVSTVVPSATIQLTQVLPVCDGDALNFTATTSGEGNAPQYQWLLNGAPIAGETAITLATTATNGDVFSFALVSSDACANPTNATSNTITIQANPNVSPTVTIAANPANGICDGQSITFTATTTNGGLTPSYQWFVNGSPVGTNTNSYTSNTLVDADIVTVEVTSTNPCVLIPIDTSNAITVSVFPPITVTVTATDDAICTYESTQITALATGGDGGPYTYTWSSGEVGDEILVSPDVPTTYTATVTDGCGSTPGTGSVAIDVLATPNANFSVLPETNITNLDEVIFTNTSINADSWTWNLGDPNNTNDYANEDVVNYTYTEQNTYLITLNATNDSGCEDEFKFSIFVREDAVYYVPNAFTIDGDALNEEFRIKGVNIDSTYTLIIFNRMGNIVMNSRTDCPQGDVYWNGRMRNTGDWVSNGVYVYTLTFDNPFVQKEKRKITGRITLID